jgi:hypothetical protein
MVWVSADGFRLLFLQTRLLSGFGQTVADLAQGVQNLMQDVGVIHGVSFYVLFVSECTKAV